MVSDDCKYRVIVVMTIVNLVITVGIVLAVIWLVVT